MAPKDEKGKKYLACSCGYNTKKAETQSSVIKEVLKERKGDTVAIVNETDAALPITEERCPKCKHNRAYWWTKQTRASDEPETRFLKCEKCKTTWRERN